MSCAHSPRLRAACFHALAKNILAIVRAFKPVRILLLGPALFLLYATLLCFPQPFFRFSARAESLVLRSDAPFPDAAAKHVLELATKKLARSPLYSGSGPYNVLVCNARWRQKLFFNREYGAGGVAYPFTSNVFLRDARIQDDRLISPRGTPVPGDRTLDYFIAHEITHQLTGRALGLLRYYQLPQWVREGYADYVGKGDSFDYKQARRAFLSAAPEMDWKKSGLYWRFHLLVAYLLDHQRWSVDRLLRNPPAQSAVEASIRSEQR